MSEQQTARQQQSARAASCASRNNPFNKAWASSTKKSIPLPLPVSSAFRFPHRSLSYSILSGPILPSSVPLARLTGADTQKGERTAAASAATVSWVSFLLPYSHLVLSPSQPPHSSSSSSRGPPGLILSTWQMSFSLHKVRGAWLTGAVSEDWQAWRDWGWDLS